MKRNLAFLLIMTSATLAQTPAVTTKPAVKPSAVKVVPQSGPKTNAVKISVAPAAKPATVSVQVAPAKPAAATKPAAAASVKPAMTQAAKVAVSGTPVKTVATNSKVAATPMVVAGKPVPAPAKVAVVNAKVPQAAAKKVAEVKVPVKEAAKPVAVKVPVKQTPVVATKVATKGQTTVAVQDTKTNEGDKKQAPKTINAVGRRDPFISPVVKLGAIGSGCSSGKRCLAIDQIALKGVVKSDVGMIAVVVNAMDKAYFLRENDPVFNGYVVKITGDSIVFKESFKDRLGKPLTRDVTKSISRPAV
jgi:hypothetical protein